MNLLAALAAALAVPLGVGHIGQPQHVSTHHGSHIAIALPPRAYLTDDSNCEWFASKPGVVINNVRQPVRWTAQHSVAHYGPVTFNGVTFTNTSTTKWANIYDSFFNGCSH